MNMKRTFSVLVILVVAGLVVLTLGNNAYSGGKKVSPKADSLWQHINEADYTQWEFFPGYEGMYPGKSPHGAYLKLYANDAAYRAAQNNEPMPDGAMLVKENYGKDQSTLMSITPMYKASEYNPGAGDWFWAKYGPEGQVMTSGKVASCISCHEQLGGGDYVVTEPR